MVVSWPGFGSETKQFVEFQEKKMLINFDTSPHKSAVKPYDVYNPNAHVIIIYPQECSISIPFVLMRPLYGRLFIDCNLTSLMSLNVLFFCVLKCLFRTILLII